MNYTAINYPQCDKVALVLKELKPRPEFYSREFLKLPVDRETHFRAIAFSVAICHQTYKLQNPVLNLYGWDYLEKVYSNLAEQQSELLEPFRISAFSTDRLKLILSTLFSHDGDPANCTLDRLDERIAILKEVAEYSILHFGGSIESWFESFDNRLVNNGKGFYDKMKELKTFSDPLLKKLTFMIKLLEESGLIKILDPENFVPIMDYHMQRVLLRTGCVDITDRLLYRQISHRIKVKDDTEIRTSCVKAFKYIAEKSGHPVTRLNDFFWSLGRSCCNERTLCRSGNCEKTPCTFESIIALDSHKQCSFQDACKASTDDKYHRLWQPVVETNYY